MDYEIVFLTPADAGKAAALHERIIDGLPPQEKAFILPKSRAYFAAHMAKGGGNVVIGIIRNDQLIAQAMVLHPGTDHPDTGMTDMPPVAPPDKVSVLQAVSVLPVFRGHGLMDKIIAGWQLHAKACGRAHLLAEIDVRNGASWSSFLKAGLNIDSIGCDPSDGTMLYNAHEETDRALEKKLTPEFNRHAGCPAAACPIGDITAQQRLMEKGFVITGRAEGKKDFVMKKITPSCPRPS